MKFGRAVQIAGVFCLLLAGKASGQAWRGGNGRVEGTVKDAQNNPIENATISMRLQKSGVSGGPDLKTNGKGHWAILGVIGGTWNIDISAPGFQSRQISYNLKEFERNPNIDIQLAPEVKKVAPHEEITVGGKKISKEAADALDQGNAVWNEALKSKETHDACRSTPAPGKDSPEAIEQCEKATDTAEKAQFSQATTFYEKALPELTDNAALLTKLEMAGYLAHNYDQAEKYAKMIVEREPANSSSQLMVAELELQKGNLAEGKAALEKVPDEKITDPTVYMNLGIILYNKNQPKAAVEYFTRAIEKKEDLSEAYYYRGLARYQSKDHAGAKADFQKYIQIDPSGKDVDTVKELLKSMK
jgi:Tfp pilus assembly protein PilF